VLYVDDLVTAAAHRRAGHGGALLDWLIARARELGCAQCHLDSGVVRHDAHRLYLGRKLTITSHHFALKLD
jgi:GNAT superfamily N-acetyltransferase